MTERTLLVIKPDMVAAKKVGEILFRFEVAGFRIVAMQMVAFDDIMVWKLYGQHEGKDFYARNAEFIKSGSAVCVLLEGNDAVRIVREMVGKLGQPGTIRGDYGTINPKNAVHASDSLESAKIEVARMFYN